MSCELRHSLKIKVKMIFQHQREIHHRSQHSEDSAELYSQLYKRLKIRSTMCLLIQVLMYEKIMVSYKKEKLVSFSTVMLKQAESLCPPPAASTSDGFRSN